jgi:hypothetical protein
MSHYGFPLRHFAHPLRPLRLNIDSFHLHILVLLAHSFLFKQQDMLWKQESDISRVNCINMTLEEFTKKITKANLFERNYFYFFFIFLCGFGIFILYDIHIHPLKYQAHHSKVFADVFSICMILFGIHGFRLLSNRYKALVIESSSSIEKKKLVLERIGETLGCPVIRLGDFYYKLDYQRKWWTSGYRISLALDLDAYYFSIQSITAYGSGGFIDFGGAEKLRRKILTLIEEIDRQ